jgi:hypothetical protein
LSVAANEAAGYWREVVRQLCVRLGIEPTPGTAFRGEISRRAYGDFSLAVSRASGGIWRRTRGDIARGDEDEYLCATVLIQGRGVLEQAGRQAELVPGSLVFYDTSEPFALRFDEPWEQVVVHVQLEQALASAGVKRSAGLLAVRLDGDGVAGAAAAFLRSLAFAQRDDPDGADLLAQYIPGLLASSLNVLAARQSALRRAASGPSDLIGRERVLGFLRAHLVKADASGISLRGSHLAQQLSAWRLRLPSALNLTGGFQCHGRVDPCNGHIGGSLAREGATLSNPGGRALTADGLTVDRGLFLTGAKVTGVDC